MSTFGYLFQGASTGVTSANDSLVNRFYLSSRASISKLTVYNTAVLGNIKGVIYADSSGEPGTLLGTTSASSASIGWTDLNFVTNVTLEPGMYWIGAVYDNICTYSYDAGLGGVERYKVASGYSSPADPWDTAGDSSNTNLYSVYATYTELALSSVTPFTYLVGTAIGDAGTSSSAITNVIDSTGATLIIMSISRDTNSNPSSISDSLSNQFKLIGTAKIGAVTTEMYYCIYPTTGIGHQFYNQGTNNFSAISILCFAGGIPSNYFFDKFVANGDTNTVVNPGSFVPTQANELIVSCLGFTGTGSTPLSISDSFTKINQLDFSSGVYYGIGDAYKIQTTATVTNPTWTKVNSNPLASIQAAFKLLPDARISWTKA